MSIEFEDESKNLLGDKDSLLFLFFLLFLFDDEGEDDYNINYKINNILN